MTKRKLFGIMAFVVAMFVLIGGLGQFWVTNSEPYELGRAAVAAQLGIRPELVELKRLAPFKFNDGTSSGNAVFVLCGPETRCFTVAATKHGAHWSVVNLVRY